MKNEMLCVIGGILFGVGTIIEKLYPPTIDSRTFVVFGISIICVGIINKFNDLLIKN